MTLSRELLVAKYDAYYRAKPNKWASEVRNAFAFRTMARHFPTQPQKILDIGCGNGHTLEYFGQRWQRTALHGVDFSTEAVRLAKQRVPRGHFITGWIEDMEPRGFELVILLGVAEHFEDLPAGLAAVRRMIADDGLLYIEVPNCIAYPESEHVEGFRELATGNHQYEWHLFRASWERILLEAGLETVESLTGPTLQTEFVWVLRKTQPVELAPTELAMEMAV